MAACIAVTGLMASEHHGVVKSAGQPVPGATVTAINGDKKISTTTDENGVYAFPNLDDGVWTIQIDMLGFAKATKEVGVAPEAPSPIWDLKPMTLAEVRASLTPAATPAAPAAASTTRTPAQAASNSSQPAASQSTTAAATNTNGSKPASTGTTAQANGGRGNSGAGRGGNGRPSLRDAVNGRGGNGFQRLDVNASGDGAGAAAEGGGDLGAGGGDLAQSSADAFVVGGSVSSGLGMPQSNDWGMGRPGGFDGFGPGGMGMGGPGGDGMNNPNGPGGDNTIGGGRGGRGGPGGGGPGGGGPGGGPGMMAGGPGGFGGGRGGGFGGGGFGGRGGPGGRGDRGGRGGRSMNSFGNGRRNARPRYNGNVAFIFDNSVWDARAFSLTGQDTAKPSTANARMTAMFGGPLKIPHLVSGDKTTFTINYQFTRARLGTTQTTLMPTEAMREGDFSQALNLQGRPVTIVDPATGQPFAGNMIPQSQISQQALGLLSLYPLPNFVSTGPNAFRYNYQVPIVNTSNQDNINTRINHTINAKNQIFGNFSFQRADNSNPNAFGFIGSGHQNAYNTGANWTYHFNSHVINTLSLNFSRNSQSTTPFFANKQTITVNNYPGQSYTGSGNVSQQVGISGNYQAPNFWGPPSLSFSNGFAGLSDSNTVFNRAQTTGLSEAVRYFKGTHQFQFGGDFRRVQNNPISQANPRGNFTFNGALTGYDFADFLLGRPDTSTIAYGNADKYYRNGWFDVYAADNWALNANLSLNLSARWDYQMPTTEVYGRLVNLLVGPGFQSFQTVCATTVTGCTPASQVGLSSSLLHGDPHEFQPRVGFAWKPIPKHSTVVRGGYGIYFNTSVYQNIISNMAQQAPLSVSYINPSPSGLFFTGPPVTNNPLTTFAVDPNFRIGYSQNWQLAIQQSLPWALVATVTYSGAKGTHQIQEFVPNSTPPGLTNYCALNPLTCPTNLYYMTTGGNSISNNLWLQLQRRFRSGLSGNLMYMHASTFDDASVGGRGQGSSLIAQNWLDLEAERARSAGIRAHTFTAQMQYSTGMGTTGGALLKGWKGAILKNWTVTTNITVASGAPETPTILSQTLGGTGITGPLRGFYWGGPLYIDGVPNPAAFTAPPPGFFGNAGRNILTGPTLFSLNASAGRTIRLGERRSADLRFDARNALNHVSFSSYNTTVGSTQYGLLQGPSAMRDLTATLRFRF